MLLTAGVILSIVSSTNSQKSYAASQDECAIWLCLPSGFAQGCSSAYSAMIDRIKSKKPPLPPFGSCSTGGNGNYKMGYEVYAPCKSGFTFFAPRAYQNQNRAACVNQDTQCIRYRRGFRSLPAGMDCSVYDAVSRPKPHFVEMWVNGDYLGKFFYQ